MSVGLTLACEGNEVRFSDPMLPDFLDEVMIRRLHLEASQYDLRLYRYKRDITISVLKRVGDARILLSKARAT